MTLSEFTYYRPYLYHVTHAQNVDLILKTKKILSTSLLTNDTDFLQTKRLKDIVINDIVIRNQAPLTDALQKCLIGCTVKQFIQLLNSKVFFYASLNDITLEGTVLMVKTRDLFKNNNPLFSVLNSGAPRSHQAYNNKPAPRTLTMFTDAKLVPSYHKVKEVVFDKQVILPDQIWKKDNQEFIHYENSKLDY